MPTVQPRFPLRVRRGHTTIKIYRDPNPRTASGFTYVVTWHVGGNRYRLRRADLADAQAEAVLQAEKLSAHGAGAILATKDDVTLLAEAKKLCGETPILAALRAWAEAERLTGGQIIAAARSYAAKGGAPKAATVPQVVKLFLRHKKNRGVDTSASYEHFLPKLAESFTGPMDSVSASLLENWIARTFISEGNKAVHPSTFNTARKRVVALWRWARNERYLPQDTLTEAERIHAMKESAKKREILTVEDFARCLRMLRDEHPDYLAAAVLAGFCGLRRDEIHAQRWADVNLKAAKLAVTVAKQGTPEERLVEIPAAAVEWLLLCERSGELVAPAWAQDRIRAFCRASKPAIHCPPNAFRHSFVSYRVAKSGSVAETAIEAGNSAGVIFKHYRKPLMKEDGEAWFALTPAGAEQMGRVVNLQEAVAHA